MKYALFFFFLVGLGEVYSDGTIKLKVAKQVKTVTFYSIEIPKEVTDHLFIRSPEPGPQGGHRFVRNPNAPAVPITFRDVKDDSIIEHILDELHYMPRQQQRQLQQRQLQQQQQHEVENLDDPECDMVVTFYSFDPKDYPHEEGKGLKDAMMDNNHVQTRLPVFFQQFLTPSEIPSPKQLIPKPQDQPPVPFQLIPQAPSHRMLLPPHDPIRIPRSPPPKSQPLQQSQPSFRLPSPPQPPKQVPQQNQPSRNAESDRPSSVVEDKPMLHFYIDGEEIEVSSEERKRIEDSGLMDNFVSLLTSLNHIPPSMVPVPKPRDTVKPKQNTDAVASKSPEKAVNPSSSVTNPSSFVTNPSSNLTVPSAESKNPQPISNVKSTQNLSAPTTSETISKQIPSSLKTLLPPPKDGVQVIHPVGPNVLDLDGMPLDLTQLLDIMAEAMKHQQQQQLQGASKTNKSI